MSTRRLAITAISIAMVAALIAVVPVPIPATGGYTHPGAVAEVFIALAFGPVVGMIAAGFGAATADLLLGFGSFAPLSLLAHGALGFLVGLLAWKKPGWRMFAGWAAGGIALIAVYFVGEAFVPPYNLGAVVALAEVPANAFQVALGILGIGLYRLVKAAYPQLDRLGDAVRFKQE